MSGHCVLSTYVTSTSNVSDIAIACQQSMFGVDVDMGVHVTIMVLQHTVCCMHYTVDGAVDLPGQEPPLLAHCCST